MSSSRAIADCLDDVRKFVSDEVGLHFPPQRNGDLKRGLHAVARDLGLADLETCVQWLRSASPADRIAVLARHLTVGETYFFRHGSLFDALEQHVLPRLIHARASTGRRLRFWSAACCTGEEPYSLAILLHRLLPDLARWDISIVGTDLNPRFLEKARKGVFGAWSFRDTPPGFRERYFIRCGEGLWTLRPELHRLVQFNHGNLANAADIDHAAHGADLILCRNALIYFTPDQAARVIHRLADNLAEDGWLMTAPSETAMVTVPSLAAVRFPGAIVFQKTSSPPQSSTLADFAFEPAPCTDAADFSTGLSRDRIEHHAPDAPPDRPMGSDAGTQTTPEAVELVRDIRDLANQGRFAEARAKCEALVALNKFDPTAHYLQASVLQEVGETEPAIAALKRALYLEPAFILAHFALGNLLRARNELVASERHFANAFELARRRPPEDVLPDSGGLTAGQLANIVVALQGGRAPS